MADIHKNHALRKLTVSSSDWTSITVPIPCSQIVIINQDSGNAQLIRTDTADADTELTLPAGGQYVMCSTADGTTFNVNDVVASVKAAAGTGPVVVAFVR